MFDLREEIVLILIRKRIDIAVKSGVNTIKLIGDFLFLISNNPFG